MNVREIYNNIITDWIESIKKGSQPYRVVDLGEYSEVYINEKLFMSYDMVGPHENSFFTPPALQQKYEDCYYEHPETGERHVAKGKLN